MPWTKKDIDDDDTNSRHGQAYYLLTEDPVTGDPLTTIAEKLYCNVSVPDLDDDGTTYRTAKYQVNVNDALTDQGLTGAQRNAFLNGLKSMAAWAKAQ